MRWRQFCAELLAALDDARRSSWSSPSARCWPRRRTPGRSRSPAPPPSSTSRTGSSWSSRRTRDRPASSASSRTPARRLDVPAVSFWAAVPHYVAAAAVPEGDARAARPGRGPARGQHPARRPARGRPRLGARRRRAGRGGRGRRRVRPQRSRRPRTPPSCPRPAARRSPGSSSATSSGGTSPERAGPLDRVATASERREPAERARPASDPDRPSPAPALGGVGLAAGVRRPRLVERVDSAARGVEVVGQRRQHVGRPPARSGRRTRGPTAMRERHWSSLAPAVASVGGRSTPSRCGSGGRSRASRIAIGSTSLLAEPRDEDEVALGLRHLLAVVADHAGVHVGPRERRAGSATCASEALISWCGKTRSLPPPWTSIAAAEVLARDRGALDVPAGPAAAEGLSPRPARPGARPARPGSRAGPSCRAGRGRRRARRRPRASARGSSRRPRRTPGRRRPRSRGRPSDVVDARPASCSRSIISTTSGIDSTAPT